MKEIQYKSKWYKVGDKITINREVPFLFFWSKKKDIEHIVTFIGNDCAATCVTKDKNVWGSETVIIGSIRYV